VLLQEGGVAGEGYQSRHSPHTKHELFVGLSLPLVHQVPSGYTAAFVAVLLCIQLTGRL